MPKIIDSLYLHFPFCAHLCNYCDFYKKVPKNKVLELEAFHKYLTEGFAQHRDLLNEYNYSWSQLETLYIGGGTPSLWGIEGAYFLKSFFSKHQIDISKIEEFTLEVNPGAWTKESLLAFQNIGVNRYSLGIQSLNEAMIKYLDRVHSIDDVYQTLEYFSKNKFNFSVDFMLGLPFSKENKRNIKSELEKALSYGPSHFSVYILTVKDNYPHFKNLPDEEWIADEFLEVSNLLKENGFMHYEVSNFSLPTKQSIHNLNYWKSKTVAAMGPSATGFLAGDNIRYKWKPNSPVVEIEKITADEFFLEKIYMGLRSEVGVNFSLLNKEFENVAKNWEHQKLAIVSDEHVKLTSKGYLVLDSLINELFSLKIL